MPTEGATREAGGAASSGGLAEDVAILRDESREQLELLRQLVRLLLPKGDDNGPKLEDLIAALVAQQRDIILAIRQVQSDVIAVHERLDDHALNGANGRHANGNGAAQA